MAKNVIFGLHLAILLIRMFLLWLIEVSVLNLLLMLRWCNKLRYLIDMDFVWVEVLLDVLDEGVEELT